MCPFFEGNVNYFVSDFLNLPPGISVGLLRLTYLGQVQTNPTLNGYIEGCPPVPAENLSRPFYLSTAAPFFNYFGASSVTLEEAETTTYTFSTSDSVGTIPYDITAGIGFGLAWKTSEKVPELPIVFKELAAAELTIQAKYKGSETFGKINALNRSSSWTSTYDDTIALRGEWEPPQTDPANYINPQVGRMFLPANIGYALVTSATADLYAMQLNTTGAMVGKVTVPNLDIPPDTNIITFQIDPSYIKNGTLDGKIGLENDPNYPQADTIRGSYFKPNEAYQLKRNIQQQNLALEAYFTQFNVTQAYNKTYNLSYAEGLLKNLESKLFVDRSNTSTMRKSLVNTYV
jgi:large repetitive protein